MTETEKLIVKKTVEAREAKHNSRLHKDEHSTLMQEARFEAFFELIIDLGLVNAYLDEI